MSPTRLQLEGPDLAVLLEQVRTQYGAGARIVQAEKVRRGGVGGFFAREQFHLQIEVTDGVDGTPIRAAGRDADGGGTSVRSVMDLVDRLNEQEDAFHREIRGVASSSAPDGSTSSPSMSTQSASFADVLTRLQHSVDGPVTQAVSVRPAAPTVTSTTDSKDAAYRMERRPRALAPGRDLAARAVRLGVPAPILAGVVDPSETYRRLLAWVQSRPAAPLLTATPGQVIVVVGEVSSALRAARAIAREIGADPACMYLAVSGTAAGHDVPVARLLSEPTDIALRRTRWRHEAGSMIVVVEATLPLTSPGWVPAVVSALAPTFTWAVAQACTKVPDVTAWAARVGQVDALALEHVAATVDPAAALAGPLPVGLLDGHRASVPRWMTMLTDEGDRQ